MRIDAVLIALTATLATCIALRFYVEYEALYSGAYDCYMTAQRLAEFAARNLTRGISSVDSPAGWEIILLYRNGTQIRVGTMTVKTRCYAYRYANVNGDLVLILARG